jgi:hypothetical protein
VPSVQGLDGVPVDERSVAGLTVVVSVLAGRPHATREAALAHAAVIDALAAANDAVLPARFGTWFASTERLTRDIFARADEFRRALDGVRGCVEIGVRVARRPEAPAESRPVSVAGSDHLRARLTEVQDAEWVSDGLHGSLRARARASALRRPTAPDLLLDGAYLVEMESVPGFRQAVTELELQHPELAIVSTGPWPPYSFTQPRGERA